MKLYLITYKLTLPESSYANLITYLKTAPYWARPMESTWIIKTEIEAVAIRDAIKERVHLNDKVLVIEFSCFHWATFNVSKEVTDWFKSNL